MRVAILILCNKVSWEVIVYKNNGKYMSIKIKLTTNDMSALRLKPNLSIDGTKVGVTRRILTLHLPSINMGGMVSNTLFYMMV